MCCSKKFVLLFRYNNSDGAIALFMIIFASAAAEAIQAAAVERIEEGFSRKTPAGASVIDSSKVFMTPASEKTCF